LKDFRVLCSGPVAEMIGNLGLANGYTKMSTFDTNLPRCLYIQFISGQMNSVDVQWALDQTKSCRDWMTVDAVIEMFSKTRLFDVKPGQKFKRDASSSTFLMLRTPTLWYDEQRFYQDIEEPTSLYHDNNLQTIVKIVE